MKKVGIVNVQWANNYGAVLVAYGIEHTIKSLGYEAITIDYKPEDTSPKKTIKQKVKEKISVEGLTGALKYYASKLLRLNTDTSVNYSSKRKKQKFDLFRNNYLNRSIVVKNINDASIFNYYAFVVGSDVIWKPDRVLSKESDIYFLKFTKDKKCKRISYAASVGTNDKTKLSQIEDDLKHNLSLFDRISVREKSTQEYLQSITNQEIECCIDPTLLIDVEDYYDMLAKVECVHEKYIYMYLFEDNNQAYELVNYLSHRENIPVICQCGQPRKVDNLMILSRDDGPLEFLNRIKNAEYVITDSFHGTVFSVLFHKKFLTVDRGIIGIRMKDLLERLNLSERFVETLLEGKQVIDKSIDYNIVDREIEQWKAKSLDFLIDALEG